jgi:hypothetical protein
MEGSHISMPLVSCAMKGSLGSKAAVTYGTVVSLTAFAYISTCGKSDKAWKKTRSKRLIRKKTTFVSKDLPTFINHNFEQRSACTRPLIHAVEVFTGSGQEIGPQASEERGAEASRTREAEMGRRESGKIDRLHVLEELPGKKHSETVH